MSFFDMLLTAVTFGKSGRRQGQQKPKCAGCGKAPHDGPCQV